MEEDDFVLPDRIDIVTKGLLERDLMNDLWDRFFYKPEEVLLRYREYIQPKTLGRKILSKVYGLYRQKLEKVDEWVESQISGRHQSRMRHATMAFERDILHGRTSEEMIYGKDRGQVFHRS